MDSETPNSPLFREGEALDPLYNQLRDDPDQQERRSWLEGLWDRFSPYCADTHFLVDVRTHFHQRTWELLLANLLLEHGFELKKSAPEGPDLQLEIEGGPLWIEAVAPAAGSGEDRAERVFSCQKETVHEGIGTSTVGTYRIDHDKMAIRYTGAVREKASLRKHDEHSGARPSQYVRFVDSGVIGAGEPFIVAINAGAIDDADLYPDIPDVVRAVFPIGKMKVRVYPYADKNPEPVWPERRWIAKASGATVGTDAFLSGEYTNLSAILFCADDVLNFRGLTGSNVVVVHNPTATTPIPLGLFKFGKEYWMDSQGRLEHRKW